MENPLLSVVTVTYNCVKTLEESILSVINQTYLNVEYIIIDGDSTDGTVDLIKKYQSKISYWISEPDKGIYDAMNKALSVASGDFLIFIGADDHFMSFNTLKEVACYLTNENTIYYGNVFRNTRNDIYKGHFGKYKISLENICHQSIFYPKSVYKNYSYNLDFPIYADYYYNLTLFPKYKFQYIPVTISYYNYCGFSSQSKDPNFVSIVNSYVRKQNGLIAWCLRNIYQFYKKIR